MPTGISLERPRINKLRDRVSASAKNPDPSNQQAGIMCRCELPINGRSAWGTTKPMKAIGPHCVTTAAHNRPLVANPTVSSFATFTPRALATATSKENWSRSWRFNQISDKHNKEITPMVIEESKSDVSIEPISQCSSFVMR